MEFRVPALPKPSAGAVATFLLRWLGGLLCFTCFTFSRDWWVPSLLVMYLALARTVVPRSARGRIARLWRLTWTVIAIPVHLVWLVVAVVLGEMLAGNIPPVVVLLVTGASLGTLATLRENRWRLTIPTMLPLGLWITGCMVTWNRLESRVACDDVPRTLAQPGVTLAIPTVASMKHCEAGAPLAIGRYPRQVRFLPEGEHILFTTAAEGKDGNSRPSAYAGSVCSAHLQGEADLRCVGEGSGEFIADPEAGVPLFATATGDFDGSVGALYTLTEKPPLRIVDERHSTTLTAALFADRERDTLGVFSRDSMLVLRQRMSDRLSQKVGLMLSYPSDVRYDAARHEGLLCGGATMDPDGWGLVAVFTPEPFTFTSLHKALWSPFAWTGGCDWTSDRQTILATVPAAGLLVSIDRASPEAKLKARFVGIGARAIAIDERRGRLYLGGYVSGEIRAIDSATGREITRWFVGHSLRDLRLRSDGSELLAATTLGIVRVSLDAVPDHVDANR